LFSECRLAIGSEVTVVMPFYRWFGLRLRRDWTPLQDHLRLTLSLKSVPPPGWYMMSVRYHGEQTRCYGLFRGAQGRVLIHERLRRRLVRIPAGAMEVSFVLHGMNGHAALSMLRLVPQPAWRVRRLLRLKLRRLHPGYDSSSAPRPLAKLWSDYNRLLSRGNRQLVGYDEWLERRERPALARLLAKAPEHPTVDQAPRPPLRFLPGIWGEPPADGDASASIRSLEHQLAGPFERLEPSLAGEIDTPDTWLVLLQSGDQLAPHALLRFHEALLLHPEARVLYADEDRLTRGGRRHSPQFKPSWNADLLYGDPHYSHCWLIRSDLAQQVGRDLDAAGEPLSLYSLALEATAAVSPEQIVHLPEVLYHRADRPGEVRGDTESATTLEHFLARRGHAVPVTPRAGGGHRLDWPLPDPPPLVSVIIPTRDRVDLLRGCLESLQATTAGDPPTEWLVIDNGSSDPACLAYLEQLERQPDVRLLRRPGPFNYAAFNNEAASLARGEVLAFLNNDVQALRPGWLKRMVAECLRPGIGAVGARLLFADGSVQHAGVLLGIGGVAGHAHKYEDGEAEGYQHRLRLTHQVSAVTAATLVLRKSVFDDVAGFDALRFAVNYNDVDLCLRLLMRGYRNLYCPDAVLIHHESRTRGAPSSAEALGQWQRECAAMQERWGHLLRADPYYSPHLSLVEENFSLALRPDAVVARPGGVPAACLQTVP
jgi:GT2 family glycosyltransferase